MSKREANTQLTKDGGLSEDDGFSVGSQAGGPQRATAAQMAARKLAKPRGGRRPGTPGQARYPNAPNVAFTQTQPSLFQSNNSGNTNGTEQHQGGFGSANGAQPNQTSQSFPPFNAGSSTGFNPQFTAPNGGFSFSAGQTDSVNNPFANAPAPDMGGFKGSIFNLPAQTKMNSHQKYLEGQQAPLFAAHSPFHNGTQNASTPDQSQSSSNPLDVSAGQQTEQPSGQQGPSIFAQQQTSGNMFPLQQPATTGNDLFASFKQSESQTPNSPFGQASSIFQQPQASQAIPNLFAHLGKPQPSTSLSQDPASSTVEDYSMMSTSPDTSPQTTPFGVPNGSNAQPQPSPTKSTTVPNAGSSFFDRVSSPTNQPGTQPSWMPGNNASTPQAAGSLFDRVSKPTTEASVAPLLSSSEQVNSLGGDNSFFDKITKPTDEANTKASSTLDGSNPFQIIQSSNTANHISASSRDQQPAKKKLFGRSLASEINQPPSVSSPSIFSPRKENPPQPASSSAQGANNHPGSFSVTTNAGPNGQAIASRKRKLGSPPDPLENCTEDERTQLITGWRLKLHDAGLQKRLRTNPSPNEKEMLMKFYRMREQEIIAAKSGPLPGPAPGSKRKATEEQHSEEAQGKKPKLTSSAHSLPSTLPNGTGSTSSQTSSIFKNILGASKSRESTVNGNDAAKTAFPSPSTVQYPSLQSTSNDGLKSSLFQPKSTSTSSMLSTSNDASEDGSHGLTFPGTPYQPSSNSFFASKASGDGASAPSPKPPAFGLDTSTPLASSSIFSLKPTATTDILHAKKPATASTLPNGATSTPSTMGASKSFSIKPTTGSEASSTATQPPSFKVPTFGAGAPTNFLSQFGKAAEKSAEEAKQKRKAEDYDSEEEDEAAWERKYEEEQRVKKQKLEETSKGKTSKYVDGKWQLVATSGEDAASTKAPQEKSTSSPVSVFDQPRASMTNGHNIFGHLSGEESGAEGSKTGDADDEDDGQDEGHDEDENDDAQGDQGGGIRANEQKASSNPFEARLSRAASLQHDTPSSKDPNRKADDSGLSGFSGQNGVGSGQGSSRFMTSKSFGETAGGDSDPATVKSCSTSSRNIFGQPSATSPPATGKVAESPTGDHTWKADSPIKFGNQSNPPAVNITAPSPSKSPLGGLFGASKVNNTAESPLKPASSLFSTSPSKAPATGFGFALTPTNTSKSADAVDAVEPGRKSPTPTVAITSVAKPATSLFALPSNNGSPAKPATSFFASTSNTFTPANTTKPTASLFASTSNSGSSVDPTKPTTNLFSFASTSSTTPSANPLLRSLAPPSNTASGSTSRATSPGATTGESANESTADNEQGDLPKDAQVDLMTARPGEENEDVLFEVKAKVMLYDPASEAESKWIVKGVGPLRVMKHRVTGVTRLLLRAEPSGRVAVNAGLLKDMTYESVSAKAIRVPIANDAGKVDVYTFKVGKDEDAKELVRILTANKPT